MTPGAPPYNPRMADEQNRAERVLSAIDGVRGFFGGLLLVALAVAAMEAGGTAGWALGVGVLAYLF